MKKKIHFYNFNAEVHRGDDGDDDVVRRAAEALSCEGVSDERISVSSLNE